MIEQYNKSLKKKLIANQNCLTRLQFQNKFSLVSIQKIHNYVSLRPHLYRNELTGKILCNSLNWKFCNFVSLVIQNDSE